MSKSLPSLQEGGAALGPQVLGSCKWHLQGPGRETEYEFEELTAS